MTLKYPCFAFIVSFLVATGWAACASASVTTDPRQIEAKVLAALNNARLNPQAYIADLQGYRRQFEGKVVRLPGSRLTYRTREGTVPVDEAVDFLASRKSRVELQETSVLQAAAADHVAEQSRSGRIGHYSANGSGPGDRAIQRGGGKMVAEVIAYGAFDPLDVVRQLIVDDGVPDRGHRTALFAAHLRYAGVACGPHPTYRTICVIDMAETPDGRP
ncbi:CAP domain-containing protein [Sphingomonas crocodyli]|uniref:CAP domain-containing protein n=1 Tax=Sphingomonas crocodyli TaxID=1979270 RepID=A0A437LXU6_9SPHN|nr:CAP domain-containing protein [Sphingomonas crocodyli]RVT90239.1 CAP domain-containing protein [Sphingomonas crocodyli]